MTKKNKPGSGPNSGSGPADPNLASFTPDKVVPLPSIKGHLQPLVSNARNGNGHVAHPDDMPAAPAVKLRPEPAPERLDPTQQELDDFSPENLKSAEEMGDDEMGLSGAMSLIKVKRPGAKLWFRCHPDPKTYINVRLIKNDVEGVGDDKFYFVPERFADHSALVEHWRWFTLFPYVTRQGVFGFWALSNRDPDTKELTEASMSGRRALAAARAEWVRCWWAGRGNLWKTLDKDKAANVPPPIWPYNEIRTPQELVRVALADFRIDSLDHQLVKYLDGRN